MTHPRAGERSGGTAPSRNRQHLAVLGAVEVEGHPGVLRPKERAVLAALAFDHPHPVPTGRLVDLVWGEAPPATAAKALHNHITRLRRSIDGLVVTGPYGYGLAEGVVLDVARLELVVDERPGGGSWDLADLARLAAGARGLPFADLPGTEEVVSRRHQVARSAAVAEELHVRALLEAGRSDAAEAAARHLADAEPDREQRWWLLAVAVARLGRRREALAVVARARAHLADRGLGPGPDLVELERLVIAGDPTVASPALLRGPTGAGMVDVTGGPVGADAAMARIDAWLAEPAPKRALALVGAAGTGKTTLARAVVGRARERDLPVLTTGCDPDPTVPLQPVVDLLEQLVVRDPDHHRSASLAALGMLSAEVAAVVGVADGRSGRHDLLDAVRRVFASPPRPTLVVIEDVHWAPPLTVQAIGAVVEGAGTSVADGRGTRVLLTTRPVGEHPVEGVEVDAVELEPWTPRAIEEWLTPHEPDDRRRVDAAAWLHLQTGGVPLFVRELALSLLAGSHIGAGARGRFSEPASAPQAILAALAVRIARLGRAGTRAVETAAIVGTRVDVDLLVRGLGVEQPGVDEARRADLLVPDGDGYVTFEHELLRRAALERLGPAARAEIHHLVLEALGPEPDVAPAVMARHAVGAASIDAVRAVAAAEEAALAALRAGAHGEAGEWWLAAASIGGDLEEERARRGELRTRAGEALLHAGDPRALDVLFDAATEAEGREDWEGAARAAIAACRLGPTSTAGTTHTRATELCDRLLTRIERPDLRAALAAATAMVHSMDGATERCRALFDQAEADAMVAGTDEALVDVLPFAYMSLASPWDLDRRETIAERLGRAATRLDRADSRWSALHLRFSNQLQRGDPALRATARELAELSVEVRRREQEWELHYVEATVRFLDHDLVGCEQVIGESLQYADTIAESRVVAVYGVQLLAVRLVQDRLHELVDQIAGLADAQPAVGAWQAALALAAARSGADGAAREAFDRALVDDAADLAPTTAYTGALVALGEAAVALGDTERAARIEELLRPWVGRWSWVGSCTLGPIDSTLARLASRRGDRSRAAALATDARRSARLLGAPWFERTARPA